MPTKKRVTHRDVARLAGVSTAVVSYVVNGGPRATSPEARRRVLDAIDTLSYHPSAAARGLRTQRTCMIGFISYDYYPMEAFYAPWNAGVLTGLTVALQSQRHYLLPFPQGVGEDLDGLRDLLHSSRVDGIVLHTGVEFRVLEPVLDLVAVSGTPCVCIERAAPSRYGFSSVVYDDEAASFAVTCYLLELGHRRIAHLAGDARQLAGSARLAGYKRALQSMGLAQDEALIAGHSWRPADAGAGVRTLLALANPPTAIFAANDQLAMTAMEVLRSEGRQTPDDIALIGFDDVPLSQELVPPLTTVHIPFAELGRRAADLILRVIESGTDPCVQETVPLDMVRRDTA